ncbi:DNA-3-methyladenine glycosylase I [Zavarzinia sp. CC-PAN008]|uniref:DNA-3-methyladenine glycosylase I n=1 Tax=Zavarzinia sp. CC-PAN008 TaxID=3243332 RepID=UPI003F749C46
MLLRPFAAIREEAAALKGGQGALDALMPVLRTPADLARIPDDRWLAEFTRCVFQAGFSWSVVDAKWPAFEAAFEGFDPRRWQHMDDDDLDRLLADRGLIRNGAKLRSVGRNAALLAALATEYGTAAQAFAEWPQGDFIGLLDLLKRRGDRLGGNTGMLALRRMGRDGFMLSPDVVSALVREGVIDGPPSSKSAMRAIQAAFDTWAAESGLPFAHISRTLSASVG